MAKRKAKQKRSRLVHWRFLAFALALAALPLVLGWNIIRLQVLESEERGFRFLQQAGAERSIRERPVQVHRGLITDRHGAPLAVSIPVISLWAIPEKLAAAPEQWPQLAAALESPAEVLKERILHHQGRQFMYLRRHLVPDTARSILSLGVAGVRGRDEYQRFYPAGEVAASLVGLTDVDDEGQEGLELAYDKWLRGSPGMSQVLQDRRGKIIKEIKRLKPARPGADLALSVDLRIQYFAYRELKRAVLSNGARGGSAVVLDVSTGEILAMVNQPSHNPNERSQLDPDHQRNRAVTDLFEPGSTVKPFAAAAALSAGIYAPGTVVDTSPGYMEIEGKLLEDPSDYGPLGLDGIIARSSQVGIARVALQLPPHALTEMLRKTGFGAPIGLGFPGEKPGHLPIDVSQRELARATLAFGYGLSCSALQLARAYAVFASGGLLRPLALLRTEGEPASAPRVLDAAVAAQVMEMLEGATAPGSTGVQAQVRGYRVAGKTGTTHKLGRDGSYDRDRYLALFAGIAPASHPKIVVVVVIDEPRSIHYSGGGTAAPVFSRIAELSLRVLNVPPDGLRHFTRLARLAEKG